MFPGIDPKVDIAFKKVFGSQAWSHLTMSLIDAVLKPAPWRQLLNLELLNPYTEQMTLDDKLSILDIKARDDKGRIFNIEMQMALVHRCLSGFSIITRSSTAPNWPAVTITASYFPLFPFALSTVAFSRTDRVTIGGFDSSILRAHFC